MGSFAIIGHTAEVGFTATGSSIDEAFEQAGRALFSLMASLEEIDANDEITFTIEAEDRKALLFDFLDQLIYLRDVEGLLFSQFKVAIEERDATIQLKSSVKGSSSASIPAKDVKAVTYSEMEINRCENKTTVRVIVDV